MRPLKQQYFFTSAVMGAMLPYVSVYLREQGLSSSEIGLVLSTTGLAVLLSPAAMTLLADMRLESKHLLAGAFTVSALALALLLGAGSFAAILIAHGLYALAMAPLIPLQDGLNFQAQAQQRSSGLREVPYHLIRVWGTIGYIVPSGVVYLCLIAGAPLGASLAAGAAFAVLGGLNALLLPRTRAAAGRLLPHADVAAVPPAASAARKPLPTLQAAKVMLQPGVLAFCVAIWLIQFTAAGYEAFYPLYLIETVGIEAKWVGAISSLGVGLEIFFVLGFGWLTQRFGLRRVVVIAAGATALRMLLLAASPSVGIALATQLLHGPMVLLVHVVPPIFLNERAGAAYRSSMQGLYAVAIYGSGRVAGSIIAGYLGDASIVHVFGAATAVSALAAVVLVLTFRDRPEVQGRQPTPALRPEHIAPLVTSTRAA